VLSVAVFWSGIPVVRGPAAFALSRRAGAGRAGLIAQVLGALATVAGFVFGVAAGVS
jgi:hypothetical protein